MKKFIMALVCLMTMVVSANAQNSIVNDFATNEPTGEKYDGLMLDPQKSIKENYEAIKSLMSLHKEKNYAEYTIMIEGHYVSKYGDTCDWPIGMIKVKGKDNERLRTINGQIIEALTQLYAHSLDERFKTDYMDCGSIVVNQKKRKVETGRTFKSQNGKITKEYIEKEVGGNTLYYLYSRTELYKKIYNKVVTETKLEDGGELYELEKRRNSILH